MYKTKLEFLDSDGVVVVYSKIGLVVVEVR
jgi:hypothetical protein